MLKRLILILGFLALGVNSFAQNTLSCGTAGYSFTTDNLVDSTAGTSFALYNNTYSVTWQTIYGTTPGAISISLQGSNDNNSWSNISTSTATAGEIKTVTVIPKFIRGYITSHTGGSTVTLVLSCVKTGGGSGGGSSSGGSATITTGSAAPDSSACDDISELGQLYLQTGDPAAVNTQAFICTQAGPASYSWMPISYTSGTTAPATCSTSALFFDTDATAGSNLYACTSANTWTLIGGLPSTGSTGMVAQTGAGTTAARTITGTDGIDCTNGSGVSGDPTCSVNSTVSRKGSSTGAPPNVCGNSGNAYQLGDKYIDTSTDTVYFCAAINRWIPLTGGRGALLIYDDFISGTTSSGNIGSFGWNLFNIASGIAPSYTSNFKAENPGLLTLSNGVSGNGVRITTVSKIKNAEITGKDWYLEVGIIPGGVGASSIADTAISVGFSENGTATPTSQTGFAGIGRFYAEGQTTTWVFMLCDSSTTGCGSSGDATNQDSEVSTITPSTSVFTTLKMWHLNSGVGGLSTYYFQVNSETAVTFCSSGCNSTAANFPAGDLYLTGLHFMVETGATRTIDLDYVKFILLGISR